MLHLIQLLKHAQLARAWVVVVSEEETFSSLVRLLPAVSPVGSKVVGRTVLFPEAGGRLTLTSIWHAIDGNGYHVAFLGRKESPSPHDEIAMHGWRTVAEGVLIVGNHPGEVKAE
jgi:hypothetical protein